MAKRGRKSKYETHIQPNLVLIADMCRNDAIDKDIWEKFGISKDSLYEYKKKYPEFSDILKRNKDVVDSEIENELFNNAKTHTVKEEKAIKIKETEYNEKGYKISEKERIEIVVVEREIPGDVTAQIFVMKNRRPKKWRDKQELEHSVALQVQIVDDIK